MFRWCITVLILIGSVANADNLFESALLGTSEDEVESPPVKHELNGSIKAGYFGSLFNNNEASETSAHYSEALIKLTSRKKELARAFTEFRILNNFRNDESEVNLREAYLELFLDRIDFILGEQIVVWGRADGINPTNNITPYDYSVFSPDEDESRTGNFLCRSVIHGQSGSLEIIWIPTFKPTSFPVSASKIFSQPVEMKYPGKEISKGSIAIKLDLFKGRYEGSASLFEGYLPQTGFDLICSSSPAGSIRTISNRVKVIGFDFSTSVGKYGLRGEFAYTDTDSKIYNSQLEYVLGLDREISNLNVIIQYIGKYITDFEKIKYGNPIRNQDKIDLVNRIIFSQLEEYNHSISCRPALSLAYETIQLEILGIAKLSTDEFSLTPKFIWEMTDEFDLTIGMQWYQGPENTLFGIMEETRNNFFVELKTTF